MYQGPDNSPPQGLKILPQDGTGNIYFRPSVGVDKNAPVSSDLGLEYTSLDGSKSFTQSF